MVRDTDTETDSRYLDIANYFYVAGKACIRLSLPLILFIGLVVILYIGGGGIAILVGLWNPPYPFLSLTKDRYFLVIVFITGCVSCLSSGGAILLLISEGVRTVKDALATILACVGFGLGATLIRYAGFYFIPVII